MTKWYLVPRETNHHHDAPMTAAGGVVGGEEGVSSKDWLSVSPAMGILMPEEVRHTCSQSVSQ